ncbi:hypothetical protein LTR70_008256 [Exophiala xenobiotica]|uniref:ATP-grasp domain-containing protein n=1 Tax=Lithohypha guttulata TaxID=1690604 RepID=A0ABR0K2B4_9EURO|nr:hypothetical protein LTR24_007678 [Lithohypha guttulata]KAK5312333.1 hypothetical protein LTR70_008256 [Exophiala xenobiotica]
MLGTENSILEHGLQNLALIALSVIFTPIDSFILFWSVVLGYAFHSKVEDRRAAARRTPSFEQKTILVTGVGMTKGLALARLFYEAGHEVIGADFEPHGAKVCGRVSRSLKRFVPLRKPDPKRGSAPYVQGLLDVVNEEMVDLWVSCSGVASAVEDGEAKEIIEKRTSCKAIQFDVQTTQTLHEKHTFIERTRGIGLTVPETHEISSRAALDSALRNAPLGRQYIMKTIGMDDANRGDMTLLPKSTQEETSKHLSKMRISEESAWILQQYIKGREFCTHALVIKGQVKAFVACPSAELLMHYETLPAESRLSQAMLNFTKTYAAAGGPSFTGHLSFDFLVENEELGNLNNDPDAQLTLYPIECNPRAHTAVALFNDTTAMADAYLSILVEHPAASSYADTTANGTSHEYIVAPKHPDFRYYWAGHDLINLVLLPLLSLITLRRDSSIATVAKGLDSFADRVLFWRDGTYELWDPLPWWWLYHVYWPQQFLFCFLAGKKWSRVNVSTCKMFEC